MRLIAVTGNAWRKTPGTSRAERDVGPKVAGGLIALVVSRAPATCIDWLLADLHGACSVGHVGPLAGSGHVPGLLTQVRGPYVSILAGRGHIAALSPPVDEAGSRCSSRHDPASAVRFGPAVFPDRKSTRLNS